MERLDKEQLDNSEPFPLTNMQVHLIISEQIGLAVFEFSRVWLIFCKSGECVGPS